MGDHKQRIQSAKAEILAFHSALVAAEQEKGTLGRVIPIDEWEGLMVQCLETMTRQSCQDKTWALNRMGLVERRNREGIILKVP